MYYRPLVDWALRDATVIEALTRLGTTKTRWRFWKYVDRLRNTGHVRIPTKSATDSERMRPPLGAERRKLSKVTQSWPTSGFFASRLRIDSPFKVIL